MSLAKGARSRGGESAAVSRALLRLIARASGCGEDAAAALPLGLELSGSGEGSGSDARPPSDSGGGGISGSGGSGSSGDALVESTTRVDDALGELYAGRARCVELSGGRAFIDAPRPGRVYLPGSFNPLHAGHRELLAAACRSVGAPLEDGCYELSVGNADKGMLPPAEARARAAQFEAAGLPVVFTRAPLYVDKADLFPRSRFVVGHDTAARLVLPKYYGDSRMGE